MRPELTPTDRLSQVVFVHDYIQLVFQSEVFCICNPLEVQAGGFALSKGMPGFADALVALIDKHATRVVSGTDYSLQLIFEDNTVVSVVKGTAKEFGPEAWQFGAAGGPYVVEEND